MIDSLIGAGVVFVWVAIVVCIAYLIFKRILNRGVDWTKPSAVFKAIADSLDALKDDPQYLFDFNVWHFVTDTGCTRVSLAGVMMAHILKVQPCDNAVPEHFNSKIARALKHTELIEEGRSQKFVKLMTGVDRAKGLIDFHMGDFINGADHHLAHKDTVNIIAVCRANAATLKGLGL